MANSDSDDDEQRQQKQQQRPQLVDDNEGLHPLFWDATPANAEEDPVYQAMKALEAESTPEERAENFKASK